MYWDLDHSYFFSTGKYKLPYGRIYALPEGLSGIGHLAEAEHHKFQVIDFQMRGGARMFGDGLKFVSGIIKEGEYLQGFNDGQVIVRLDQFQGIIDDVVVGDEIQSPVWSGLDPAKDQYLFVKRHEDPDSLSQPRSSVQFNDFDTFIQDEAANLDEDSMLLAKRLSGLDSAVNFDLGHKVYVNLLKHIEDINPHGPTWYQDNIIASGISALDVDVQGDVLVDEFNADESEIDSLGGYGWPTGTLHNDAIFRDDLVVTNDVYMQQVSGVEFQASIVNIEHSRASLRYNSGTLLGSFQRSAQSIASRAQIALRQGVRQVASQAMVRSGVRKATEIFGDITVSGLLSLKGNQFQIDRVRPARTGQLLDSHIDDQTNPHQITPVRLSGLGQYGIGDPNQWAVDPYTPPPDSLYWRLQADLEVDSGISIDGVDVSELSRMMNGSVIDSDVTVVSGLLSRPGNPTQNRHEHLMLPLQGTVVGTAPEYQNVCVSGLSPGTFETHREFGHNWYDWYTHAKEEDVLLYASLPAPVGRDRMSQLSVMAYADFANSGEARFQVQVRDTDGVVVGSVPKQWYTPAEEKPEMFVFSGGGIGSDLGGTFEGGKFFDVLIRMRSASGVGIHVGPLAARFF